MYIFGGSRKSGENSKKLYRINLGLEDVIEIDKLLPLNRVITPISVRRGVSWSHGGRMYIFGGKGEEPSAEARQQMQSGFFELDGPSNQFVCYDTVTNEWSYPKYKGKPPCPRSDHAMAQIGSHVFIFGGSTDDGYLGDLWRLDMDAMQWTYLATPVTPERRCYHSLTSNADNELVLYSGISNDNKDLRDCWVYSVRRNRWKRAQFEEEPRYLHTAVYSPRSSEILIFGGSCLGNSLIPTGKEKLGNHC